MKQELVTQPRQPRYNAIEHDRYVRTVIRTIASQVQAETGKPIDENVMMVGDEWFYMGLVQNYGRPSNVGTGLSIGQKFSIQPVEKYSLAQPVPISNIVNDFYEQIEKFALIPESENRLREARELGDVVEEQQKFFKLHSGKHEISVYKINEFGAQHSMNEATGMGWTTFTR